MENVGRSALQGKRKNFDVPYISLQDQPDIFMLPLYRLAHA